MSISKTAIAVDLGAESGRVIAVSYDGEIFHLNELHRFPNIPVKVNGTLHWDILKLFYEVETGIEKGRALKAGSIGVDTWGVDFALLDTQDNMLQNPVHYRDNRTDGMVEKVFLKIPQEDVFKNTGIQVMPINTLFQIMSLVESESPLLKYAKTFLTIPDLINFWLTGEKVNEFTISTTTQLYNPVLNNWALPLIEKLGIPNHIFKEVVQPGTKLGSYKGTDVFTVACHDTGSAVAAIPAQHKNYAYISSGTWSLMGIESYTPFITEEVRKANLTNEGGVYGSYTFLKNIMGLWILQECRRIWQSEGRSYSYDEIIHLAKSAHPLRTLIIPDSPVYLHQGNFPLIIREFAKKTHQPVPDSAGEIIRCILDSLALSYREVLHNICNITQQKLEVIHIIGGGSRNKLLNQLTADATGLTVIAGPAEATVIGNAAVQFISMGVLKNLDEARRIISHMPGIEIFRPNNTEVWDEASEKFMDLKQISSGFEG